MTEQLELIVGLARSTDPDTSREAAQRITGRTEKLLLQAFHILSTWTADELCRMYPTVYPPTLVSALSRLKGHKLIEPIGTTRPSRRGSPQTVYRLARA